MLILTDKRTYTRRTRITPFDGANGGSLVNRFPLISSTSIRNPIETLSNILFERRYESSDILPISGIHTECEFRTVPPRCGVVRTGTPQIEFQFDTAVCNTLEVKDKPLNRYCTRNREYKCFSTLNKRIMYVFNIRMNYFIYFLAQHFIDHNIYILSK